jgi:hypothetical protein
MTRFKGLADERPHHPQRSAVRHGALLHGLAVKTDDVFSVTTVYVDIEGRDLEFMQRVSQKLKLVVPITHGIILCSAI